jgi:hypothetical protein
MATTAKPTSDTDGLWIAAAFIGFFLIPVLAEASPTFVNGVLLLVLFSSLLFNRNSWLPYLGKLEGSTLKVGSTSGGSSGKKRA